MGRATKKLMNEVNRQKDYAEDVKGRGLRDIPTYAQYLEMTKAQKGLFKSGVGYKKSVGTAKKLGS
jgi:hypothetical protein